MSNRVREQTRWINPVFQELRKRNGLIVNPEITQALLHQRLVLPKVKFLCTIQLYQYKRVKGISIFIRGQEAQ